MEQNPLIIRKRAGILKHTRHNSTVPTYKQLADEKSLYYSPSINKLNLKDRVYGAIPQELSATKSNRSLLIPSSQSHKPTPMKEANLLSGKNIGMR